MGLLLQISDVSEMLVIYMGIHSEKALQDCFGNGHEIFRKRHTFETKGKMHCLKSMEEYFFHK